MSERPPEEPNADTVVASDDADGRAYRVKLPMFEGPLDLLLHLIQKHELNILDIPIGFVALKYVEYIRMMEEMSIDLASEYLVMAATLAHIKSRSLLPPDPTQETDEGAEEEEEDPRAELIRRLLEYQKYKHAADTLGQREVLGRDVFQRGFPTEQPDEEAPLAPMSLFKLVDAFESVLKRAKQVQEHQIDFEKVSISDRIGQIIARLGAVRTLQFEQLFDGDVTRAEMIVTFLALLEMTKLRMTRLSQEGPLAPIVVELVLSADQVHNFDAERAFEQVHHAVEQDFAADKPWSEQEPDSATLEPLPWDANADELELTEEELALELREAAEAFALGQDSTDVADEQGEPADQLSTFGPPDEDDFSDHQLEADPGSAPSAPVETGAGESSLESELDGPASSDDSGTDTAEVTPGGGDLDRPTEETESIADAPELKNERTDSSTLSVLEPSFDEPRGGEPSSNVAWASTTSSHDDPLEPELAATGPSVSARPPEVSALGGDRSVPDPSSEPETDRRDPHAQEGSQDPKGSDVESP